MQRFIIAVLVFLAAFTYAIKFEELTVIGFVDMEEVYNNVASKQKSIIEKKKAEILAQIRAKEREIANLEQSLKLNYMSLSDEEIQRRRSEIRYKQDELESFKSQKKKELKTLHDTVNKDVKREIYNAIVHVSKAKGFAIVLGKRENTILYARKELDMTKDVIKYILKKRKKKRYY